MDLERILITVRTYPTISTGYIETVCTGGINDAGEWRRLVPVPLRYLEKEQVYKTFDVISVKLKPGKDGRRETRAPVLPSMKVVRHLKSWRARCDWVKPTEVASMREMKDSGRTLCPVAVREVIDLKVKRESAEWTPEQKEKLKQQNLFVQRKPLEKIPYKFRFVWKDGDGEEHKSTVYSWEMLETYRSYRERYEKPVEVMREKWLSDLCGAHRQVSFFMGNLAQRRHIYVVCGVFSPPKKDAQNDTLWQ